MGESIKGLKRTHVRGTYIPRSRPGSGADGVGTKEKGFRGTNLCYP